MTKKRINSLIFSLAFPLFAAAFMLIVWAIAAAAVNEPLILPSVGETLESFFRLFVTPSFYRALVATLLRGLISFAISFACALAVALAAHFTGSTLPDRIARPFVSTMRALPTLAAVLLLIVWTNSDVAPVIVTILVVLPTMYSQLKIAFTPDKKIVEMSRAFKVDKKTEFRLYALPSSMPGVIECCASNASLVLKLIVAAEVLAHTRNSIGQQMYSSQYYFETAQLMALTLAVVIIGVALELGISATKKLVNRGERV